MFVWVFHRVSGILLIGFLSLQLFTGLFQASASNSAAVKAIAALHKNAALNCVLVFLVVFHAMYGVRTIILDLGSKRERLLFWCCTILATVIFACFLVAYFSISTT